MELYETEISVTTEMPFEEVLIMPVGDLQLGAIGADLDRFQKHIEWGVKNKAYFIFMGDAIDIMSPSNREAWKSVRLYDSVRQALDQKVEEYIQEFLGLVKGTEGRWLGWVVGHHTHQFPDGTTSDTRIAQVLKAPFLGTSGFIRVRFRGKFTSKNNASVPLTLFIHHGVGSGAKVAAPLNKLENIMHGFDADIYLIGHHTRRVSGRLDQLYMSDRPPHRILHREKILVCTGGFFRGYVQGSKNGNIPEGTYVEKGLLNPVTLGAPILRVRPIRESRDGVNASRLDISVET